MYKVRHNKISQKLKFFVISVTVTIQCQYHRKNFTSPVWLPLAPVQCHYKSSFQSVHGNQSQEFAGRARELDPNKGELAYFPAEAIYVNLSTFGKSCFRKFESQPESQTIPMAIIIYCSNSRSINKRPMAIWQLVASIHILYTE